MNTSFKGFTKNGFIVFILIVFTFGFVFSQLPDGNYRVANVGDGLSLTIQGGNASYASVVSDNWLNFADQIWKLRKIGNSIYHITPKRYQSNNVLSYHFDIGRRYAQAVIWKLMPLRNNGHPVHQISNERTRDCLVSFGRRRSINETTCDKYDKSQLWKLTKIM